MKVLLFGTGDYYRRYKKWFDREDVVALLDNNAAKHYSFVDGIEVISPDEGVQKEYDYIIILSFYVKSMKQQLTDLGVADEKILHFFELYRLSLNKAFEIELYGISKEELFLKRENAILLLSTDLELQGGPATVLIRFAKILKKNGYSVVFGSMQDGARREILLSEEIPVVIDPNLQIKQMKDVEWTHGFRKVICNTIGYNVFISKRDVNTQVLWWLHDSAFFYDGVDRELLKCVDQTNLEVYSVGKIPRLAIQEIIPGLEVKELLYGVEEVSDVVIFIVLGYVEPRKGQDILIRAIQLLDEVERKKALFYLVGNDTSQMAEEIKKQIIEIPQVIVTGKVSEKEKKMLMKGADVLICPSREDPMPASVVEATMIEKMPIVSDAVGLSDYIKDGVNGMVFANEDSAMLAEKISYCIKHPEKIADMGREARKIYDELFSMAAYEKQILKIIERR